MLPVSALLGCFSIRTEKEIKKTKLVKKFMYFIKFFTVLEFLVCADIPDQANRPAIYKNQYRKEDRKSEQKTNVLDCLPCSHKEANHCLD